MTSPGDDTGRPDRAVSAQNPDATDRLMPPSRDHNATDPTAPQARDRDRERERDRDATGRAKNARPRDGLGRPLDRTSTGEPIFGDDLELAPGEALPLAQRLIDDRRPFHAHEVLEAAWKTAPAPERPIWKGLAQIAVGLTHARRENAAGATALLRRGAQAVADYNGVLPAGLDATAVVTSARRIADRIELTGLTSVSDEDLRLPLISRPTRPD
jgi:hypothetical protein